MDVKIIRTKRNRNGHVGGFVFETKKHIVMLCLFLIFFFGLLMGNFFVKGDTDTYETVESLFSEYISSLSGQTILKCFYMHFLVNFVNLLINFIFGFCAIGFPVPLIMALVKGISVGAFSSFMYSEYSLKGFGYCMLIFYPIQIISCLIMMRAGKDSFSLSTDLLRILFEQQQRTDSSTNLKLYLLRFLILFTAMIVLSLVSAVLSIYIVELFNF